MRHHEAIQLNAGLLSRLFIVQIGRASYESKSTNRLPKLSLNKTFSNRNVESEEDEEDLTERERRRKKRRQKDTVDESFDPHTMQEIQSLVKVRN